MNVNQLIFSFYDRNSVNFRNYQQYTIMLQRSRGCFGSSSKDTKQENNSLNNQTIEVRDHISSKVLPLLYSHFYNMEIINTGEIILTIVARFIKGSSCCGCSKN